MSTRAVSVRARLIRLGFRDADRAERLLGDPALAGLLDPLEDVFEDGLLLEVADAADPDLALLGLVRLMEGVAQVRRLDPDDPALAEADLPHLLQAVRVAGPVRHRLLSVLGSSSALGDHLARHPAHWVVLRDDAEATPEHCAPSLLRAVGAHPAAGQPVASDGGPTGHDRLRVAYRRGLLRLAGRDLSCPHPTALLPSVGREPGRPRRRRAGGRARRGPRRACRTTRRRAASPSSRWASAAAASLNYVSDVDVVFVAEPDLPEGSGTTRRSGPPWPPPGRATGLMRACSASTPEGTLWPVDANLRPEGKQGPLVRTIASHVAYYERWAQTWEFQALLKARPVAGDVDLGRRYVEALSPMVWQAATRDGFVGDVQAMRRRVEEQRRGPRSTASRARPGRPARRRVQRAGCSLVHGRIDPALRSPTTLDALAALGAGGYVGRDDAASMDTAYRLLRTLEHRLRLHRLTRTHLMPAAGTQDDDLRRLGRQAGHRANPEHAVVGQWHRQAREVRRLHERLFYRPLLGAAAQLSTADVRLTPDAARSRLQALGYTDPAGALRHIEALTSGVSRRAAIQRRLLPVMLGWFADEADPDAGLLAFRRVSDALGTTHWYLKMLRDEGSSAERLAHVLARSRFAAELLQQDAETVQVLGQGGGLQPRSLDALRTEVLAAVERHDDPGRAVTAARSVRRREPVPRRQRRPARRPRPRRRRAGAHRRHRRGARGCAAGGAVRRRAAARRACPPGCSSSAWAASAARSLGYGSDADVLFVHDPLPGADEQAAQQAALAVTVEPAATAARRRPRPVDRASTRGCGRRASRARSCARSRRTPPTTRGGRWRGSGRRCCGRRPWRATPVWPSGSSR
ncbi:hypothetical protein GCM10025868_42110 [Angustibacter aerolatus]|uniref:Glutamate-ammonia-ligase adenylyltransferase n=1 Tax=Angustibacter aerolatus TaxID=1162965 RepID=A0ABQ6JL37_9ACTN|nr:hypothetical protein GCM10025868_42110 [Angustibacter aerolatus]